MQVVTYLVSTKVLVALANLFIIWHVSITTNLIGAAQERMVLTVDKPHLCLPQTRSPLMNLYMNGGLNGANA
jgi:hypothetical protein